MRTIACRLSYFSDIFYQMFDNYATYFFSNSVVGISTVCCMVFLRKTQVSWSTFQNHQFPRCPHRDDVHRMSNTFRTISIRRLGIDDFEDVLPVEVLTTKYYLVTVITRVISQNEQVP